MAIEHLLQTDNNSEEGGKSFSDRYLRAALSNLWIPCKTSSSFAALLAKRTRIFQRIQLALVRERERKAVLKKQNWAINL
jgi:hypothetical protein